MTTTFDAPELEFAFEVRARIERPHEIRSGPRGGLSFTPVVGGTVSGPHFTGEVLSGGGDWAVQEGNTFVLHARYLIRHEDGTVVDVLNRGYFDCSDEVSAKYLAGEKVSHDEVYFRTSPVFQTDSEVHGWLARRQFVGVALDEQDTIVIRFFLVR